MMRSPSAEPATKSSKRKGTRSVSTLTPTQLARKRANDREAQRAIRARTKEHIERLERELKEAQSRYNRDETVQALLRRNKELEKELLDAKQRLYSLQSSPYPQGYNMDLSTTPGMPSRASSFTQGSPTDYSAPPNNFGGPTYLLTPEPCEPWTPGPPLSSVSGPSVVSSPCPSTGQPEDYLPSSIPPTSMPTSMMGANMVPQPLSYLDGEDVDNDRRYTQQSVSQPPPTSSYMQQSPWPPYQGPY